MNDDLRTQLVGRWTTNPNDIESLRVYGLVTLVFAADGSLRYIVQGDKKNQIMILKYRVEDGVLITDQPSAPREERTPFKITSDGELLLQYGQVHSRYLRDEEANG
jgi:hypothetical protein